VSHISGMDEEGKVRSVRVTPPGVSISNFAFDVTPARLISGIITERGVFAPERAVLEPLAQT